MTFSFVILDLKNEIEMPKVVNFFNKNYSDYEILYCASKHLEKMNNVKTYLFNHDEDSEKILNSVIKQATKTNIVVVREFTSCEDILRQTKNLLLTNQIVYYKKQASPFKMFFYKLFHKIARWLFSKEIILCNFSCVTYGEIASNVLKRIEYPSNLMRTNQWQGIQLIGVDGGKECKFKYKKTQNILQCILPLVISILFVCLFVIFKNKLDILTIIIFGLIVVIGLVTSMVFGINWVIKSQIGENILEKAIIKEE